jgi:hypothetical protein
MTEKDKQFLERLRELIESKDLRVELRPGQPSYMILRGNYGDKVDQAFRMTRQGVRWRFHRLFNDVYVSAFSTILFVEKTFGPELRDYAIRISRERYALRQEIAREGFRPATEMAQSPPHQPASNGDRP